MESRVATPEIITLRFGRLLIESGTCHPGESIFLGVKLNQIPSSAPFLF
jgi:hypothetical protein